jgi:hypothetical protein
VSNSLLTATIAALTALAASGVTSWLTLRGVRHQVDAQRDVAARDHAEKRAVEIRAAQKSACIQFMESAIRCAARIQEIRRPGIADDEYQDRLSTARDALSDLIRRQAVLSVEGPSSVAVAATEARGSLDREFAAACAERTGGASHEAVSATGDARWRAVGRVGQAARRAFGNDDGPPLAAPCVATTA